MALSSFPSTASIRKLGAHHPDYEQNYGAYDDYSILYEGGKRIKDKVTQFLRKRPKELSEVYVVRQLNFSYTNLLGQILGWYLSAIFKTAPQLVKKVIGAKADAKLPADVDEFCQAFEQNCDQAGTTFVDFWVPVLESLLLYRSCYVLTDLPGPGAAISPVSLGQQTQLGLLNPYLVAYDPMQVINWETDAFGNLEWLVIYLRVREAEFLQDGKLKDYWYYFDRQQCALYSREVPERENALPDDAFATLEEGYPRRHAMSEQNRVPLRKVEVPKGLWLANRVYLPLLNHLNQDNALDFGLFQANLAMLIIEDGTNGRFEEPPVSSEVGYLQIPNGGDARYLEPEGAAFETSQKRIADLEERIYKMCYLQDQARTNRSTPTAQSGISKSMDKMPSRDAMCGLGDILRAAMQLTYQDVLTLRGFPKVQADIRGLDFSDKATAEDLDLLDKSQVVAVNSETFEREIAKKLVRLVLADANPETLELIDQEIEDNPTPSQEQAQQQEEQKAQMLQKFDSSFAGASQLTQ